MVILHLFRFLLGYVKFKSYGGFCERFINLCACRKINIRNIELHNNCLYGETSIKDYFKLREISAMSGMKTRVVKKCGLPFAAKRNKNRVGLLIGAVFFVLFMSITSMYVWNIDVVGTQNISEREISQALNELGLYIGCRKKDINTYYLADEAMVSLSGKVSWLAVNIKGTSATIEARDYIERPEDITFAEPSNIIADFDGLILSLEVFNGQKANHEGSGVKKGDLLISGTVENRDLSTQFLDAAGKITALHTVNDTYKEKRKTQIKRYYKTKTVNKLLVFGISIPLGVFSKEENYDLFTDEKRAVYFSKELPFSWVKETRAYFENQKLQDEEGFCEMLDLMIEDEYEKYKNTKVISSKYTLSNENNTHSITSSIECVDFMGEKQKISLE